MGNPVRINLNDDDNTKKTSGKDSNAGQIKKFADLEDMVAILEDTIRTDTDYIEKLEEGVGFCAAQDAIARMAKAISAGPHTKFYSKYSYLQDPARADKFLNTDEGPLDYDQRQKLYNFHKALRKTTAYAEKLLSFMNEQLDQIVVPFCIIRSKKKLECIYKDEDRKLLIRGFNGFDLLCRAFDGKKFSDLGIEEMTIGFDEAKQAVLKKMKEEMQKYDTISGILDDPLTIDPAVVNLFQTYDKESASFCENWYFNEHLTKSYKTLTELKEETLRLRDQIADTDSLEWRYFNAIGIYLVWTSSVYSAANKIVKNFNDKKTEAPYSILHVDYRMENCINNNRLPSMGDVFHKGTQYAKVFSAMPARLNEIAERIARNP